MRRISLVAAFGLAALLAGFAQVGSIAAVPATYTANAAKQAGAEPSEQQMRQAFEHYLSALVSRTLVLVAQTGGEDAVRKVRQNGNDRFEIRAFRKLQCEPSSRAHEYDCEFVVDVRVVTGPFHRTMRGHFVNDATGLLVADAN
jgi:hypothetical protein